MGRKPTVIVTGAGSGLGAATARHFAEAGWNVMGSIIDDGQRAAVEAVGAACITDVREAGDCARLVAETERQFGGAEALVNAAGITKVVPLADLDGLEAADFHAIYAVNTVGVFLMSRAAAPLLRRSGDAAIVNIASHAARAGGGSSIAYAASKGAVNTLTLSLARVLAPEIRVNAICPNLVEGGFFQRMAPDRFDTMRQSQEARAPLRRIGQPSDVAQTIYWLVVGAPLVTGEILGLDCGMHLNAD